MEKGLEKGVMKGRAEGLTDVIRNLMTNMGLPIEQAMAVLDVPETDRPKYKELLQKQ